MFYGDRGSRFHRYQTTQAYTHILTHNGANNASRVLHQYRRADKLTRIRAFHVSLVSVQPRYSVFFLYLLHTIMILVQHLTGGLFQVIQILCIITPGQFQHQVKVIGLLTRIIRCTGMHTLQFLNTFLNISRAASDHFLVSAFFCISFISRSLLSLTLP